MTIVPTPTEQAELKRRLDALDKAFRIGKPPLAAAAQGLFDLSVDRIGAAHGQPAEPRPGVDQAGDGSITLVYPPTEGAGGGSA